MSVAWGCPQLPQVIVALVDSGEVTDEALLGVGDDDEREVVVAEDRIIGLR